jgi:cardiolipin synthase
VPRLKRRRRQRLFSTNRLRSIIHHHTGAEETSGNRAHLLRHGGEFFPALFSAIQSASRFICLDFYIIRNDITGKAFADALTGAAGRGVAVLLLYDYIGSFDTSASYFRRLEEGGVRCLPFNPPPFRRGITWFDKRDHRKFAVIDGIRAFIGGVNVGDEYAGFGESPKRWRDTGMEIEGPAVCRLLSIFRETWLDEGGVDEPFLAVDDLPCRKVGKSRITLVNGGPHHNRSYIRGAFRMAIAGASQSVDIITPYFVPGPRILRSLIRAARRGVRVRIILPALSDVRLVRVLGRAYLAPLLKAGVEVYERLGTVLHAKIMLIDCCRSVIGSANLDQRSFHRNFELNLVVNSPSLGKSVRSMMEEDLALSRRISLDEHEQRGRLYRFCEWLLAPLGRFL